MAGKTTLNAGGNFCCQIGAGVEGRWVKWLLLTDQIQEGQVVHLAQFLKNKKEKKRKAMPQKTFSLPI